MRLFLLPLSTRRSLLYCPRPQVSATEKQSLMDKIQTRAARLWGGWEKKDKGWQRTVVNYGNYAFRRIPYEEWGLKSVPPLSKRRKTEEGQAGAENVEVVYPGAVMPKSMVSEVLHRLSTGRDALHRRKLTWCLIGMPFTAPIAVIPIVPNLPFFYLVYRAWSHWRSINGGKHIQFLLEKKLVQPAPSPVLDEIYKTPTEALLSSPKPTTNAPPIQAPTGPGPEKESGEAMLLSQDKGKRLAQALDLPELEVELERAIWQVETQMKKQNEELAQQAQAQIAEPNSHERGPEALGEEKK